MFRSFGIDNIVLRLRLPFEEIERLIDLCSRSWIDKHGMENFLLLGPPDNPTITFQRGFMKIIVNLNVPKLVWLHNLKLAKLKEIRLAFRIFRTTTGLKLENAEVLRV